MTSKLSFSNATVFNFASVVLEMTATPVYKLDPTDLSIWTPTPNEISVLLDEGGIDADEFTIVCKTMDEYELFVQATEAAAQKLVDATQKCVDVCEELLEETVSPSTVR